MNTYRSILSQFALTLAIVLGLVFAPALIQAQSGEVSVEIKAQLQKEIKDLRARISVLKKEKKELDKVTTGGKKPCTEVPPGQLIASGFLLAVGGDDENVDALICKNLPPGIAKKIIAVPSVDTQAPIISAIEVIAVTHDNAVIQWTTNERSTGRVYYARNGVVVTAGDATLLTHDELTTQHTFTLHGLLSDTHYAFILESKDAAGNITRSSERSFMTAVSGDRNGPVISNVTSSVTISSATISWATDEPATSKIYYATFTPLRFVADTTRVQENTARTTSHSETLTGLSSGTTYYFVVESRDAAGNKTFSTLMTFTTSTSLDTTNPVISGITYSVAQTSATVQWSTSEPASSKIYYGTSTPLWLTNTSTNTKVDTMLLSSHSMLIQSLTPSTTYYFVVESQDGQGNTTRASELSFRTAP